MRTNGVYFEDEVRLAKYISELTRQGVAYEVNPIIDGWEVVVTGF